MVVVCLVHFSLVILLENFPLSTFFSWGEDTEEIQSLTYYVHFSQEIVRSLDVLDSVIGEFDDGFLSDTGGQSLRATRTERTKGQFSQNKIDRIFDDLAKEIYDYDEKVERLNNFQICSSDKVIEGQGDDNSPSEIPAPGSFMVAKQLYLENLDRVSKEENIAGGSRSDPQSDRPVRPNVIRKEKSSSEVSSRPAVRKVSSDLATGRQVILLIITRYSYLIIISNIEIGNI